MFNILTVDCNAKVGGSDKAEKICRDIIITVAELEPKEELHGFEFYHSEKGEVTVTTNSFQLAIMMAEARLDVKRKLENMLRNRQVRGYYANPLFMS